jgi:acetyl esterase/lipase
MKIPLLAIMLASLSAMAGEAAHFNIPLWPAGQTPGALGNGPLDEPFLTVFAPPVSKRNGTAVVIAPGGANIMLMYGLEGVDIAERFNDWGATAFVLTYRLNPRYGTEARTADGNRAMRLVRARAKEFGIDPQRILFIGFSAGSFLARQVAANATAGDAQAQDPIERQSSKPNFLGMVYGPGRAGAGEQLKDFPPTYLLAAAWDAMAANASAQLFQELNQAGAVVELHLYQKGRHGFGAATKSPEFGPWMDSLKHFLQQGGYFAGVKQ